MNLCDREACVKFVGGVAAKPKSHREHSGTKTVLSSDSVPGTALSILHGMNPFSPQPNPTR